MYVCGDRKKKLKKASKNVSFPWNLNSHIELIVCNIVGNGHEEVSLTSLPFAIR